MSTVFLWLSSDQKDPSSISNTDFRVILTNRIDNPVSADLVQVQVNYTAPMASSMFISSRALGQSTVSGNPNGSGLQRWWRSVPWLSEIYTSNSSLAFYNPRVEHTPVFQEFLKDIDIQLTDINGQPISPERISSVSILVAVKVSQ
jgi:hypothetical protein